MKRITTGKKPYCCCFQRNTEPVPAVEHRADHFHCVADVFRQDPWEWGLADMGGAAGTSGTQKDWGKFAIVPFHIDSAPLNIPSVLRNSLPSHFKLEALIKYLA